MTSRTGKTAPAPAGGPSARPELAGAAVVAHRGASGVAPENTLSALREAVRLGADAVEFDVRRTRDGRWILAHDPTWERTTDAHRMLPGRAPWRVTDLTFEETRRLDAGAGERVPTLAEALELLRPTGVHAVVELKTTAAEPGRLVESLAAEIANARMVPSRIIVQSFDHRAVQRFRALLPEVGAGALVYRAPRSVIRDAAAWADLINVHHAWLDRAVVGEAHARGMTCMTWTVNRSWQVRRALACGADGIVTDHPGLVRRLRGASAGADSTLAT
jgi:glycerophosphoryl diester phosphodiesterase